MKLNRRKHIIYGLGLKFSSRNSLKFCSRLHTYKFLENSKRKSRCFCLLYNILKHKCDLPLWWSSSSTDILVGIIPSVVNMKGAKVSTNFIQHSEQKQNLVIRLLQNQCISLWKLCTILQYWREKNISIYDALNSKIRLCICRIKSYLRSKNHL